MKTPTSWSENISAEANEYPFDSAVMSYDSSESNYDGVVDSDMSEREILPTSWGKLDKDPTSWLSDTSELHPYDSAVNTYDSEDRNYDGVVDTNRKTPTIWRNA